MHEFKNILLDLDLPLILVTGVLDISSTGDGSTVCEML